MNPCPFCGSRKMMVTGIQTGTESWYWVMCLACECNGPAKNANEAEAIERWNSLYINEKGGETHAES